MHRFLEVAAISDFFFYFFFKFILIFKMLQYQQSKLQEQLSVLQNFLQNV